MDFDRAGWKEHAACPVEEEQFDPVPHLEGRVKWRILFLKPLVNVCGGRPLYIVQGRVNKEHEANIAVYDTLCQVPDMWSVAHGYFLRTWLLMWCKARTFSARMISAVTFT